ncbi:MAG TPA: hypothetical protein VHM89_14980 [Acidimicrobiales bacterium]|nr:hypothetical protein [Acidimicrobiales bacterium]
MNEPDPEARTQHEVEEEAAEEEDDPVTSREELEVGLMDDGASDVGEEIGQEMS